MSGIERRVKLSEVIHIERKRKRISQTELGKRTGLSRNYISLIERDLARRPSLFVLEKLATALDMTLRINLEPAPQPAGEKG